MEIRRLIREELENVSQMIELFDDMLTEDMKPPYRMDMAFNGKPTMRRTVGDKSYDMYDMVLRFKKDNTLGLVTVYKRDGKNYIYTLHIVKQKLFIDMFPKDYHKILTTHFFEKYVEPFLNKNNIFRGGDSINII